MRYLIALILLGLTSDIWAVTPEPSLPANWQTQCFGRVQFSMPAHLAWYNQQAEPPAFYKGSEPTPAIWRGNYGRDPLHEEKVLVQIAVSRLATLDYWKRDTSYFKPSRGEAQERVIQKQLDEIKARKVALLSDQSEEANALYSQLREEERALEQAQQHIGKISTDILWVSEAIENFKEQGRDTAQLEAKLAELLIEDAKFPTDDLFEQEYFVELNRPNALAISGPFDFSAKLWENGRIYTFQFGMQHNKPRSEQASLEPAALDFLARFRARAEHEIPTEPGVCIPFGFIADSGNEPFDFGYQWRPRSTPALLYRIDQPASSELFSMAMRRLIPNAYSSLLQINRFGPQDVAFGYQAGSLVGTRFQRRHPENPDWQPPQSYHLIAETGAHGTVPPVSFEMKVHDIDGEYPLFEQGEAEFKQILDTFRPLPGMVKESAGQP
ncbi:hypothetical protein SAMN05216578_11840 [Halopseudomonas formosensis]|uniref:Uncharacterized protein n=1 Tax=Halopseudomonas formosensis TaxID=1002526 RepID=A0A1I6C982_9GAMM|nr:T6SS immunity protein Tli4 family protein [Halopseudomonas formosensis]SFQ89665.1 hypothetical protein SAMN05216578_11840 [Halopseudomonas formosensis]